MAKLGYCIPCGEGRRDVDATVMVGEDPMCAMHAQMGDGMLTKTLAVEEPEPQSDVEQQLPEPAEIRICSRGCGGRAHRGRCRGAAPKPLATLRKYRKERTTEIVQQIAPSTEMASRMLQGGMLTREDLDEIRLKQRRGRAMDRLVAEEVDIDAVPKTIASLRTPSGRAGELWLKFQTLAPGKALKVACRDKIHVGTTVRNLQEKAAVVGIKVGSKRMLTELWVWKEKSESQ